MTLAQSPPVALCRSASFLMPHSSASRRQPCDETRSHVGTCACASTSSNRTAYGAPEAPVTASTTGSLFISDRGDWGWGSGRGGAVGPANAERGSRNAEQSAPASRHPSPFPFPASPLSCQSVDQRAEEHDHADNAVHGEEGRIEA